MEILGYLLTFYMLLLPLWSEINLSKVSINGISINNNAEFENWFKIVKHNIFPLQINTTVRDFIHAFFLM